MLSAFSSCGGVSLATLLSSQEPELCFLLSLISASLVLCHLLSWEIWSPRGKVPPSVPLPPSLHPPPTLWPLPASLVSAGGPAIDPLSGPRTLSPLTSLHTVLSPLSSSSHLLPPELVSTVTADLLNSTSRVSRRSLCLCCTSRGSSSWRPQEPGTPPAPCSSCSSGPRPSSEGWSLGTWQTVGLRDASRREGTGESGESLTNMMREGRRGSGWSQEDTGSGGVREECALRGLVVGGLKTDVSTSEPPAGA